MNEDWDDEYGYDDDGYGNEEGDDYDHEYEPHDDETGPCPECGADLHVDAENCYACGHWLTTAERHKLWDAGSPVRGAMGLGKFVLIVVLIGLMVAFLLF